MHQARDGENGAVEQSMPAATQAPNPVPIWLEAERTVLMEQIAQHALAIAQHARAVATKEVEWLIWQLQDEIGRLLIEVQRLSMPQISVPDMSFGPGRDVGTDEDSTGSEKSMRFICV